MFVILGVGVRQCWVYKLAWAGIGALRSAGNEGGGISSGEGKEEWEVHGGLHGCLMREREREDVPVKGRKRARNANEGLDQQQDLLQGTKIFASFESQEIWRIYKTSHSLSSIASSLVAVCKRRVTQAFARMSEP